LFFSIFDNKDFRIYRSSIDWSMVW